jgi:hypothetical protein
MSELKKTQAEQDPSTESISAAAQLAGSNMLAPVNVNMIAGLCKQLGIQMPRNNDLKSKNFLRQSKEKMWQKLFATLNKSNGVELDFKRERFTHYKGFIGRGNNSAMLF